MADSVEIFKEQYPSLESYWRSIVLFGVNVASYKFALAKSLLEITHDSPQKTSVSLEELADPFSRHICQHIALSPKQATSQSSKFLDACKEYNEGRLSLQKLHDTTVRLGFNNVIDAFHIVNHQSVPVEFYKKDYDRSEKRIILTDELFKLGEISFSDNLLQESESRWNLVETAWSLGISRNLLNVQYDNDSKGFFVDQSFRRKDITSARGALNGYQKGKCFYCFDDISVSGENSNENLCDVDHFFPHTLQPLFPDINLDGVWNLVLACPKCNRGVGGKFALVPNVKYLERLHKRNEFLISSHHPLRETIIRQTGATEKDRISFLKGVDQRAIDCLIHRWETVQVAPATF